MNLIDFSSLIITVRLFRMLTTATMTVTTHRVTCLSGATLAWAVDWEEVAGSAVADEVGSSCPPLCAGSPCTCPRCPCRAHWVG